MADLTTLAPASSFAGLLNLQNTTGLTTSLQVIQDGFGTNTPLSVSTIAFNINTSMGPFSINSVELTATATELNDMALGIFSGNAIFDGTGAISLPRGTTAQRPDPAVNGDIRYNTTTAKVEAYANDSWQNLTA